MEQQPLYPPQPQFSPTTQVNPPVVTPPQNNKSKHTKILIISLVLFTVALGAYAVWLLLAPKNAACLTREDYQAIAGEALPDDAPFSPTTDFYGLDIEFNSDSANFTDSKTEAALKSIGQFAKQHSGTSLLISIQAAYTDKSKTITEERATAVSKLLIEAGVSEKNVSTDLKLYDASDSLDDSYDDTSADTVSITITSSETCQ